MRKIFWTLVVCAALIGSFMAGLAWRPKKVMAATVPAVPQTTNVNCSIPKSWGTFRGGFGQSLLAFEDSSGTVRVYQLLNNSNMYDQKWCTVATRQ
jgi:hypothetical protein